MIYRFKQYITKTVYTYVEADSLEEALEKKYDNEWFADDGGEEDVEREIVTWGETEEDADDAVCGEEDII